MRKISTLFTILTLVCTYCNLNKPLDYYNIVVTAGNTSLCFHEFGASLERLESGMKLDPQDLAGSTRMQLPYNEGVLEKLNGMLGKNTKPTYQLRKLDRILPMVRQPEGRKLSSIVKLKGQLKESTSKYQKSGLQFTLSQSDHQDFVHPLIPKK